MGKLIYSIQLKVFEYKVNHYIKALSLPRNTNCRTVCHTQFEFKGKRRKAFKKASSGVQTNVFNKRAKGAVH